ncbi:MAG: hypothetical protein K0Q72_5368 [Armatimonadetes bacterium]|nr:hypothetical protein [Armatimonadota bacterium]
MAMGASNPGFVPGRLEELQRENETLKEQLRRAAVQTTVARGAISDAITEKETTARLAHQVSVEERATRAAVEVQGNNIGFSVILQIMNFLMLIVLLVGLFVWLPREIQTRVTPSAVVNTVPGGGTIVVPR